MLNTRFERLLVTKECVKLQIGESVLFGIVSHFSWMARGHSVIKRFGLHLTVSNGSGLIWDNPKHFLRNLYCGIFCGIWFYASDEKIFGNYRFAIKYISQRSVLQVIQMKKKEDDDNHRVYLDIHIHIWYSLKQLYFFQQQKIE